MIKMGSKSNNLREIYELYNKLYAKLSRQNNAEGTGKNVTKFILNQQTLSQDLHFDETTLHCKISVNLSINKSKSDAEQFMQLYQELKTCLEPKRRIAILTFLYYMTDSNGNAKESASDKAASSPSLASNIFMKFDAMSKTNTNASNRNFTQIFATNSASQPTITPSSSSSDIPLKLATIKNVPHSRDTSPRTIDQHNRTAQICELTEELVQDVIYSFTGIQGKYLKKDIISGGFKLDPKTRSLTITHAGALLRLAELGYYHDQIQMFTDSKSGRSPLGLLGQGLVTALRKELTQYYGMVAMLQEKLNRQRQSYADNSWNPAEQVTLLKLMFWAAEPMNRLKWLTNIAEECQEKKGGELMSVLAEFQYNGNPSVKALVRELLLAVCGPLQYMLSKWLLEGEINDPHSEFFIEILPEVGPDRLWSDKYRVREAMLPNFISRELANKILVTGKSINFLREVCQDKTPIKGKEDLKNCFESNSDYLFSSVPDTKLHLLIDTVYLNTSKKVLDIVKGPYKLLQHLQAMKNYLLLGQGDFVAMLMENLKPELDRQAKDLYSYELSSILDLAIRSTNAQFDDPEIINQLDVFLLTNFEEDLGWDVFTLKYTVSGPLATMLEPSMSKYQLLFKPLWQMKHLEFVLSQKIWKNQKLNAKLLRSMQQELNPITYRLHLYTSEMIHFIHLMQYYILFEVIECFWTNMYEKVQQAEALDDILQAHEEFLHDVKIGAFLDKDNEIFTKLSRVFTDCHKLEVWQDKFYDIVFNELEARKQIEQHVVVSEVKGKYGMTAEKRLLRDEETKVFEQKMVNYQGSLDKIGRDYEASVRDFLLTLASSTDHNLQLFGTRLDFNEYYKKRDDRLLAPLLFANIRQSSMHQLQNGPIKNLSRNSSRN